MKKVGLMWHGDRETRNSVKLEEHRLGPTTSGLREEGLEPVAAVYNDDFADEVFDQVRQLDAVLVWVNPIESGRDRTKLDAMLRRTADCGVLVSSHPETIQKMGTKEVLYQTRFMSWGTDVHVYRTSEELRSELPKRLAEGKPRVLKQYRGHSGHGVWKVTPTRDPSTILARHAARGSVEQELPLLDFLALCDTYLAAQGRVIDQEYQERLEDGMVRCYLVKDEVAGFGHQEINALFPAPKGTPADEAPQPGPRLYYPPTKPEFQSLRRRMETEWLGQLLDALNLTKEELPFLWDADFFFRDQEGNFALCEINVSSVYPYPEDAVRPLARAVRNELDR